MTTWTSVNSIANLKAQSAGTYQSVEVLGYYAPGDGGGGDFFWNSSSTAPDNGSTTIMPSSKPATGRWQRLVEGPFSVRWFGAKGDGTADDTTALQSAIDASAGKTLILPPGNYIISRQLKFNKSPYTYSFLGAGRGQYPSGSRLSWRGPNNVPLFDLQGLRDSEFADFSVDASATYPCQTVFLSTTITGRTTTKNRFENIYLQGTTTGIGKGWQFVSGSGGDNNNDENLFQNCTASNFTVAAWSFEHSQSKAHRFYSCNYYSSPGATNSYGLTTALGTGSQAGNGGSFVWYAGFGGGATVDFYLGGPNDAILISGGNFEGSGRLLECAGADRNSWPITIEGCRWADDNLNADGKAIIYLQRGPLNLIGNTLGARGGTNPLQLFADTWDGTGSACATAIGNSIYSTLSNPFMGATNWNKIGNGLNTGPMIVLPNQIT